MYCLGIDENVFACTIKNALTTLGYGVDEDSSTFMAIVTDPDLRRVVENILAALGGAACTSRLSALLNPLAAAGIWSEIRNLHAAIVSNPAGSSVAASVVVTGMVTTYYLLRFIARRVTHMPIQGAALSNFMATMNAFIQRLRGGGDEVRSGADGHEDQEVTQRADLGAGDEEEREKTPDGTPSAPPMFTSTPFRPQSRQPEVNLFCCYLYPLLMFRLNFVLLL